METPPSVSPAFPEVISESSSGGHCLGDLVTFASCSLGFLIWKHAVAVQSVHTCSQQGQYCCVLYTSWSKLGPKEVGKSYSFSL